MPALLELRALRRTFGGVVAVRDLDLTVHEREVVGLIGPNGAGKTTVFNLVTGVLAPTSGAVLFDGQPVTGLPPHRIAGRGVARSFQATVLFGDASVRENVMVGAHRAAGLRVTDAVARPWRVRGAEQILRGRAEEVVEFLGLGPHRDTPARALPYGLQKLVGVAMALASGPRLLLMDEPTAGMNETEKGRMMRLIGQIRDRGVAVLLVEHDMRLVMGVCDRIAVLDFGQKIAEGPPETVQRDRRVIDAYLGTDDDGPGA